mgnify:FL=1
MLEFIVGTMIFVIIVTVCLGVFSRKIAAKSKGGQYLRSALKGNMALMASLVLVAAIFLFSGAAIHSSAADTETVSETEQTQNDSSSAEGMAYLAAALSTGLATIGAGIAVAVAGSAALGAISEDSKLLGKTLIFVGLAEGIAIYGLIISIMILNQV